MSGLVYSYLRFSDPRQATGHSIERQMGYAVRWASENGMVLDESLTLRDEGLSAYHQRHVKSGALGAFLSAIEEGRIVPGSVLVVEGLDRLSRAEPIQAQAQLAQIINAGITVVTASDGKTYSRASLKASPMDLVYSLLIMIRAHEESDTKSKRIVASIKRQCEAWVEGNWRGVIRNGGDPSWVRLVGDKWELIPERVAAVRTALALFKRGHGALRIVRELASRQLDLTNHGSETIQIYRILRQRSLIGEKTLTVEGKTFQLADYYPQILTMAEWEELQSLAQDRGRRPGKGELPHVLTGMRVLYCGYCGGAYSGQTLSSRPRLPDGRIRDCYRRLLCAGSAKGAGCPVRGSTSVAPIERALMSYCSDMVNLRALYKGPREDLPRAELVSLSQELADLDLKLERLTDAMLASGDNVPTTFAKRAIELEAERDRVSKAHTKAERDLSAAMRVSLDDANALWRALAEGVEMQDHDARLQARQLVADTFERITVYHKGRRPAETPKGQMDVTLLAKGGLARLLRIDKDGCLISAEEVDTTLL